MEPRSLRTYAEEEARGLACDRSVIYVLPYLGIGGTELHVLYLVKRIVWRRCPVVVAPEGSLRGALEAAGAVVRVFADPTGNWLQGLRSYRRALGEALGVAGTGGEVPVVHVHSGAELLWLAQRWVPEARFVFTDHGYFGPGSRWSYRFAGWVLRRSSATVIVVSSPQRALWTNELGLPGERVRVIPNGVPDPVRETAAGPVPPWVAVEGASATGGGPDGVGVSGADRPPVVGAVGRLEPQKGFEQLLQAFEEVAREVPQARLVVVGRGSMRETLKSRVEASPRLRKRVTLAGEVSDARLWMRYFDVFCLPSVAEALPLSLLEAMASGCGIVATWVGGVPEALGYGEAGLLVPPRQPEALAGALVRMLKDVGLRRHLAGRARARYLEHFTDIETARRTVALYARL